jgi:aspartate/methionine/tyrosine aminotransferase
MTSLSGQPISPFTRLNALLAGVQPGLPPINMHVGEPQHPIPGFVGSTLSEHLPEFGKYPPIIGPDTLRQTIAQWLGRRFHLSRGIDPGTQVLPLVGTREGLFTAAFVAISRKSWTTRPAILIPNPFYQCYAAAALSFGAEAVFVNATRETGFLPDFESLPAELLARTAAIYICSPSNPEGASADRAYWQNLFALADAHDITIFADECYSEIYVDAPPCGALTVRQETSAGFERLLVFHSLSKRSSLAGLRSGFIAGDAEFIAGFREFRNVAGPQLPLPIAAVSERAWADEKHVEENRSLYRRKFERAKSILSNRIALRIPDGGFFLWLDVGDGAQAAIRLWRDAGLKVLPGEYLSRDTNAGNPGKSFIRVALVNDFATTDEALVRLAKTL